MLIGHNQPPLVSSVTKTRVSIDSPVGTDRCAEYASQGSSTSSRPCVPCAVSRSIPSPGMDRVNL